MIIDFSADFRICLCWRAVILFLSFCFLSGFLWTMIDVCHLFSWPGQMVCSECLLVLEPEINPLGMGFKWNPTSSLPCITHWLPPLLPLLNKHG
jgi:hypothetical protein